MLGRPAIPRASLRFLRSALPPCARFFLLSRRRGAPRSRGRGLSRGSPSRSVGGNGWASQVPGGPSRACPALRPRRDRHAKPLRRVDVAFRNFGTRRLPPLSISGLNHTACALAVYASQPGSPLDHARLASGWGLALAGRVWLPARSLVKFPRYFMASSSPRLPLAHPYSDPAGKRPPRCKAGRDRHCCPPPGPAALILRRRVAATSSGSGSGGSHSRRLPSGPVPAVPAAAHTPERSELPGTGAVPVQEETVPAVIIEVFSPQPPFRWRRTGCTDRNR